MNIPASDYIDKTVEYMKQLQSDESSGHDWWHTYRVWQNAQYIAEREGADSFVVQLAALLHDIADWKFCGGDANVGPTKARSYLESLDVDRAVIDHVCAIIYNISFKGAGVLTGPLSLEGQVVQDADRLDAIGAIGIARAFAYGGHAGQALYNPDITPVMHQTTEQYLAAKTSTINHFYEKLLLLRDRMNTQTGRSLADTRHAFMELYLKTFFAELGACDEK